MPSDALSKSGFLLNRNSLIAKYQVLKGLLPAASHTTSKPLGEILPLVKEVGTFPLLQPKTVCAAEIHPGTPVEKLCKTPLIPPRSGSVHRY